MDQKKPPQGPISSAGDSMNPPEIIKNMNPYLDLAHIDDDDSHTRGILLRHRITHWTYFTLSTEEALRKLGFDEGPARLLCLAIPKAQSNTNFSD
jgi:hypothetical protein